jgi:hypothetical protein
MNGTIKSSRKVETQLAGSVLWCCGTENRVNIAARLLEW